MPPPLANVAVVRERRAADVRVVGVAERGAERHAGRARPGVGVGEGQPRGPRLEVRHRIPLVARDAAVEHAGRGADRGPAVAGRIPDDADARRHVVPGRLDHAALDAGVAVEQLPDRRRGVDGGFLAGHIRGEPVERIGARRLHVPAQAEVEGHASADAEVVLHERRAVPAVPVPRDRRVLRDGAGNADHEVRQRVPRDAVVEGEDAVVVEERVLDRLVVARARRRA